MDCTGNIDNIEDITQEEDGHFRGCDSEIGAYFSGKANKNVMIMLLLLEDVYSSTSRILYLGYLNFL